MGYEPSRTSVRDSITFPRGPVNFPLVELKELFDTQDDSESFSEENNIQSMECLKRKYVNFMCDFHFASIFESHEPVKEFRKLLESRSVKEISDAFVVLVELLENTRNNIPYSESLLPTLVMRRNRASVFSFPSLSSIQSTQRMPVCETDKLCESMDSNGNSIINNYIILSDLGQGTSGKVKLAENFETGKRVAIKMIPKQRISMARNNEAKSLNREIEVMKRIRHKNCVSLIEVINDPHSKSLYLVMDYIPNGPLVRVGEHSVENLIGLNNKYLIESVQRDGKFLGCRPLSEKRCLDYLRQIVSGLQYLHKHHVVHHDIKPDNILCDHENQIYISDFGVSEIMESTGSYTQKVPLARSGPVTPLFTAPEEFLCTDIKSRIAFLSDIWSLGITLYLSLVGLAPFTGTSYFEVMEEVLHRQYPWNGLNIRGEALHQGWKTILDGMLQKDPNKRWSLRQLRAFLTNEMSALLPVTRRPSGETEGEVRDENEEEVRDELKAEAEAEVGVKLPGQFRSEGVPSADATRKLSDKEMRKLSADATRKHSDKEMRKLSADATRKHSDKEMRKLSADATRKHSDKEMRKLSADATRKLSADATRKLSADATRKHSADATRKLSADATRKHSADGTRKLSGEWRRKHSADATRKLSGEWRRKLSADATRKLSDKEVRKLSVDGTRKLPGEWRRKLSADATRKHSGEAKNETEAETEDGGKFRGEPSYNEEEEHENENESSGEWEGGTETEAGGEPSYDDDDDDDENDDENENESSGEGYRNFSPQLAHWYSSEGSLASVQQPRLSETKTLHENKEAIMNVDGSSDVGQENKEQQQEKEEQLQLSRLSSIRASAGSRELNLEISHKFSFSSTYSYRLGKTVGARLE